MSIKIRIPISLKTAQAFRRWMRLSTLMPAVCLLVPMAALAQSGSPFDTGFSSIQTLFTGTISKVASFVAIVIGGYGFAHGEPGAMKDVAPEARSAVPFLVARLKGGGLEHHDEKSKAHGELGKQIVKGHGECKMKAVNQLSGHWNSC